MLEAFIDTSKDKDKKLAKEGERKILTDITSKEIHKANKDTHEILRLTIDMNNELRRLVDLYLSYDLKDEDAKALALSRVETEIRRKYKNVESNIKGVENAFRVAIYYLEKMKSENEKLTSNDYLDAFKKIDLIRLVYDKDTEKVVGTYFIQVKSREMKNEAELNSIISERINVGDTEYNQSDKFYILRAQEMYKKLEDEILKEKSKFYLDEEDKNKVFENIRKSKLKDNKGVILNRPDTKESIYSGYKELILEDKNKYKKQIEIDKENRETLEVKISENRLEITKDISEKIFKSKSLLENLEQKDEAYLEVLAQIILNIFKSKNKVEIIENLKIYYKVYSLKEWNIKTDEDFNELLEISSEELRLTYEYLLNNLEEIKRIVNAKSIEREEEVKANILNSERFYAVIAYPNGKDKIVEEVKEIE